MEFLWQRTRMSKQVPWNVFILEEFIRIGGLTQDEEHLMRLRVGGYSIDECAFTLGCSRSTINGMIKRLKGKNMIETYSNNITVSTDTAVPFNTDFKKGSTVSKSGNTTIQLNRCGIYEIAVNASGIAATGGAITLQLKSNNVMLPNALASVTATDTTSTHNLSFTTKIQVPSNYNAVCPYEILLDALYKVMSKENITAEEKAVYEFIKKHLKKSYDRATRVVEEYKQN